MLRKLASLFVSFAIFPALVSAQSTRHFEFHYAFTVRNIPPGEKVQIWFPSPVTDNFQEVKVISSSGDLRLKQTRESKYGNQMFFAETSKDTRSDLHFEIVYDVVRHERVALGTYSPHLEALTLRGKEREQYLVADRLVPVTGLPAELALSVVQGESAPLEKAHKIYDYVFANMSYDKTGTGWGHGDVLYACNAKKGNCTDFHSLFIAMARSQNIPTRFEIGFPLPASHAAEIPGYHCWSEFFEPQHGWVPIDISEAWKHPEKKSYFFGALDTNRMQFSMGRDLQLTPRQQGPPLNYFIYPYVEVAGKEYSNVSQAFSFSDSGGESQSASKQ